MKCWLMLPLADLRSPLLGSGQIFPVMAGICLSVAACMLGFHLLRTRRKKP